MLLWKVNVRMLISYHIKKEKLTDIHWGKRFELAHQTKCHCKENADSNRKIPGLVRQIWITFLDMNSHHGKLWEKKQVLTHTQSQVVGRAHTHGGHLGLGLYQSGTSRGTHWGPPAPRPEKGPSGHRSTHVVVTIFLLNLALSLFPPPFSSSTFTFTAK